MAKGKHGHHGGAWKVAYADFVTAMMALFLVLWLTAQDQKIKEAVERAFRHPFSSPNPGATGIIQTQDVQPVSGEKGKWDSSSAVELNMLRNLMQDLLRTLPANEENPMEQTVKVEPIPDGMRVSIFDRNHEPVFRTGPPASLNMAAGSSKPSPGTCRVTASFRSSWKVTANRGGRLPTLTTACGNSLPITPMPPAAC